MASPVIKAEFDSNGYVTIVDKATDDVVMTMKDTGINLVPDVVTPNDTAPSLLVVHEITVPDGATGDVDVVLDKKTRIIDVWLVKTAGAGGTSDTITVKNGSTAITDALDINVADKVVVRAGTIDDAQASVAAAGTLRVTRTKSSANNVACVVYVLGVLSS